MDHVDVLRSKDMIECGGELGIWIIESYHKAARVLYRNSVCARQYLAVGTRCHGLQIFDIRTRSPHPSGEESPPSIQQVAWSPDGQLLAADGEMRTVFVWNKKGKLGQKQHSLDLGWVQKRVTRFLYRNDTLN